MNEYENLKRIGIEIARKISRCPKVKAVAFIGSLATEFVDKYSKDIDLVCICDDYPSVKERRRYLGKENYEKFASKFMEIVKRKEIQIDIVFRPVYWFESALKLDPYDEGAERSCLFLLQNLKPIVDKENLIKKMKKKIKYSDEYKRKKIEFCFLILSNTWKINEKLMKRNDIACLGQRFFALLERYVQIIFALNKRYYSDLKWVEKFISQFKIKPKNALSNIRKFSKLGNRKEEIKEKMKLLKQMIKELAELVKKEVPEAKIEKFLERMT